MSAKQNFGVIAVVVLCAFVSELMILILGMKVTINSSYLPDSVASVLLRLIYYSCGVLLWHSRDFFAKNGEFDCKRPKSAKLPGLMIDSNVDEQRN